MSERTQFTCPMCRGEGKVAVKTFEDEQAPYRLLALAVLALAILLGSAVLYYATTPREPSPMEQCAASCTPARFKAYTEPVAESTERTKPTEPNVFHAPVPGKCECLP